MIVKISLLAANLMSFSVFASDYMLIHSTYNKIHSEQNVELSCVIENMMVAKNMIKEMSIHKSDENIYNAFENNENLISNYAKCSDVINIFDITKVPAIIIDRKYVVYGVNSLIDATSIYSEWEKSHED